MVMIVLVISSVPVPLVGGIFDVSSVYNKRDNCLFEKIKSNQYKNKSDFINQMMYLFLNDCNKTHNIDSYKLKKKGFNYDGPGHAFVAGLSALVGLFAHGGSKKKRTRKRITNKKTKKKRSKRRKSSSVNKRKASRR